MYWNGLNRRSIFKTIEFGRLSASCRVSLPLRLLSHWSSRLCLIPTCAISDWSCKVIMFTLGESSQCLLVLMVECRNGPPPVPGEKNVIIVYSDSP